MPNQPSRPSFRPAFESLEQRTLLTAGGLVPPVVSTTAVTKSGGTHPVVSPPAAPAPVVVSSPAVPKSGGTHPVVTPPATSAPVAANDTYRVTTHTTLTVPPLLGVLVNDTGHKLDALRVTAPGHGTLTLRQNGSFVYSPQAGFTGTDSFTYVAKDGAVSSNVATVTLQVAAPAQVEGVTLNRDGNGQVTGLTVTFSEVVTFDATSLLNSPFRLIRGNGRGLAVPFRVSSSVVNGQTVAVLTVSGPYSTLPPSPYTLTVLGAKVTYGIGQFLDGDGNGTQQGNFAFAFSV
jgi:hypothetical protein